MILENVLDELRINRELSRLSWQRLQSSFGDRFIKAWKLVTEKRMKKYIFRPSNRKIWIAVGHSGEYIIYPDAEYCSCNDFYFRVLDGETALCYHLIAQKIANTLDFYDVIPEEDDVYPLLLKVWKQELRED
jgi:predicted nucleic acid-binding Zn finger protein